ncbi:MAG: right-handed parallel beta-helix repeat-containing protein [Cyanobacteria bacterium P01_G01_bin.19]
MLRRHFLLRLWLGWLLVVGKKIDLLPAQTSDSRADLQQIDRQNSTITFFVATNGSDRWTGKLDTPTANNDDGPFATWNRAKKAIRELKPRDGGLKQPIRVVFGGGTYRLTEPIVFTPEDSGTESYPICYEGKAKESIVFSGGRVIDGWQEWQYKGLRLWTVELSPDLSRANFQHLWANGVRRIRARYPNQEYLELKSGSKTRGQKWHQGDRLLHYKTADLSKNIRLEGSQAIVFNRWVESRLPVTRVDRQKQTLNFTRESVFKLAPRDLYYLENKFEFLDTPGEWYLDSEQSRLYYLPLLEESVSNTEIVVPILNNLAIFRGDANNNIPISHLEFKNLTFAHTDWHLPPRVAGYNQNAWGATSAIVANNIRHCHWQHCTWKNLGGYGIELFRRCNHNQITNCSFFDLGAGGIKIGERKIYRSQVSPEQASHHNTISCNHIYSGGNFFTGAVGIGIVSSNHNLISHNHIHDFYYTAISLVGDWGFQLTETHHNLVEHNHVHHIGKPAEAEFPFLSDLGGIYTVGNQPGTIIRQNKVHDIYGLRYGGWGIYLDEGSTKVTVRDNLVYRTSHGAFSQHYGRENVIRNNIFALGEQAQIHRNHVDLKKARAGDYVSFYFTNNIVYWQQGQFIAGLKQDYQSQAVFHDNTYWKTDDSQILFGDLNWRQWQRGDRNSQIADPLFVAPERGDFRFQTNSPLNEAN